MYLSPFSFPYYLSIKPVGAACNLRCRYCYYLEKSQLYAHETRKTMSDEMLELFTREYIRSQTSPNVLFTWHGGETLLRPISFYKKALELQKKYADGRSIDNSLQTNGTLLTEEWCRFFKEHNFLIGISIDGTSEQHDKYRKDKKGIGTHSDVVRGIELLKRFDIPFNILAVVNDFNADRPLEFYRFFKDLGCKYIQFSPAVERTYYSDNSLSLPSETFEKVKVASYSVSPAQWGRFLIAIFDEWVRNDVGEIFVQIFDATLSNWVGLSPGVCIFAERCGNALALEQNGDVYSCDHFVFPRFRLGNIRQTPLAEMVYGEKQRAFGESKRTSLPEQCLSCTYLFACNGECPKNRFATTASGEEGLNYLCAGYYAFFHHVAPYMDFMKELLRQQLPPSLIMQHLKDGKPL
ncbi:MAG: anaerobic sulfatase-maturation protein [Porphyromonas sp.]|nr:anaerobic sulfatase-maturation protein [Porphyromonas sp.]